eukprot:824983_1
MHPAGVFLRPDDQKAYVTPSTERKLLNTVGALKRVQETVEKLEVKNKKLTEDLKNAKAELKEATTKPEGPAPVVVGTVAGVAGVAGVAVGAVGAHFLGAGPASKDDTPTGD